MKNIISISLKDIFNIKGTRIYNPDKFSDISSVSIDSRKIKKHSLFIAIEGEKFNGHDFLYDAIKSGASAIAIKKEYYKKFEDLEIPIIVVNDTVRFLGQVASVWRSKLKTIIIGIGGSNGKTTTKEVLAQLLSAKFRINKTEANNNNHIGVPLTILSTNNYHKYLVLEFGSNHPGEIKYLVNIAKPDYALITNIGDSHLEFFKDRVGVLKEETELFRSVISNGRKIFLNLDDDLLKKHFFKVKNKITYATNHPADFILNQKSVDDEGKITFTIYSNKNIYFKSPIVGEMGAHNFFAAIVVAKSLGMSYSEILKAQRKIKAYDKRIEVIKFNSSLIINDCYNANPSSMIMALSMLNNMKSNYRRIAILGDMFELGETSTSKHKEVGRAINNFDIHEILTVGVDSYQIFKAIEDDKKIKKHFNTKKELKKYLVNKNYSQTIVLIKGSRGMKLEEITEYLQTRIK